MEQDFKTHFGGKRPVKVDQFVEYRLKNGDTGTLRAGELEWKHIDDGSDIVAYRAVEKPA